MRRAAKLGIIILIVLVASAVVGSLALGSYTNTADTSKLQSFRPQVFQTQEAPTAVPAPYPATTVAPAIGAIDQLQAGQVPPLKSDVTAVAPSVEDGFGAGSSVAAPTQSPPVSKEGVSQPAVTTSALDVAARKVIFTAFLSMEVKDTSRAVNELRAIAEGLGGFIAQLSSSRDKGPLTASVTLRVPQGDFFTALERIESLGAVVNKDVQSQDVSDQFVDLQARLRNAQNEEQLLLVILQKAEKIEDILEVRNSLSQVREEIEQLQGQLQFLERRVEFATITVSLTEPVVIPPSFSMSVNTNLIAIPRGESDSNTVVSIFPDEDFNSTITLTANTLPGVPVTFNPNVLVEAALSSTVTVKVDKNALNGNYLLRIKASGGGIERDATLTLVITDPLPPPSFTIGLNTNLLPVPQGGANSETVVTIFPAEDFNSTITITTNSLPGVTVAFNPNPIMEGTISSTMTVKVSEATQKGNYLLRIKASGGGVERAATLTLLVTNPPTSPFTVAFDTALVALTVIGQGLVIIGVVATPFGLAGGTIYYFYRRRHKRPLT